MIHITAVFIPQIQAIKAIRAVSGLGLKESKDVHDAVVQQGSATFEVAPGVSEQHVVATLKREGFEAEWITTAQSFVHVDGLQVINVDETVGEISEYETVDERGFIHLTSDGNPIMLAVSRIVAYGKIVS